MRTVRYYEAAEQELFSEVLYLESRSPALGRRFFIEVLRAEEFIAEFPEGAEEIMPTEAPPIHTLPGDPGR